MKEEPQDQDAVYSKSDSSQQNVINLKEEIDPISSHFPDGCVNSKVPDQLGKDYNCVFIKPEVNIKEENAPLCLEYPFMDNKSEGPNQYDVTDSDCILVKQEIYIKEENTGASHVFPSVNNKTDLEYNLTSKECPAKISHSNTSSDIIRSGENETARDFYSEHRSFIANQFQINFSTQQDSSVLAHNSSREYFTNFSWRHADRLFDSYNEQTEPVIAKQVPNEHISTNSGKTLDTGVVNFTEFNERSNLTDHTRMTIGIKPYSCSVCGKSFVYKNSLFGHNNIHTGKRTFPCSECGKIFFRKDVLDRHMFIHSVVKPYSCSQCGKSFIQKSTLDRHMYSHTGNKRYSCSECGKWFIHKHSLVNHINIHNGIKPYTCTVCDKSFGFQGSLDRHMHIHIGDKQFTCSSCGKSFTHKHHLLNHMKNKHSDIRPYSCKVCGKSFALKGTCDRHVLAHTEVTF